jgi:putative ABC transport system permease protein
MNVIDRGVRNVLRSPLRSGAIVIMMAVSIGLLLSMLVARMSITTKISDIKSSTATGVTINPAGIQGGAGGGEPLTAAQVMIISRTVHIRKTTSTLTDQLGQSDTNLTSSLELGSFGRRQQRFDQQAGPPSGKINRPSPTPHINIIGTTNPSNSLPASTVITGTAVDGLSSQPVAMLGKSLATKNNLTVGGTFTAYNKTFTVSAIFDSSNTFQNSGVIIPLATLQDATNQSGAVSSVGAMVDNSDNVASTIAALKAKLGDTVDITSQQEQATSVLGPLQSIADLALAGVVGAAIANGLIILLAMVITVRERRREIGVLKAIGGSSRKVIGQFITEALTLTVVGSVIGLTLGIVISGPMTQSLITSSQFSTTQNSGQSGVKPANRQRGIKQQLSTNLQQVSASVSPQTFALSIGIILLIAIIGSAVPAWFISKIRPAEVLRTE